MGSSWTKLSAKIWAGINNCRNLSNETLVVFVVLIGKIVPSEKNHLFPSLAGTIMGVYWQIGLGFFSRIDCCFALILDLLLSFFVINIDSRIIPVTPLPLSAVFPNVTGWIYLDQVALQSLEQMDLQQR